MTDTVTNPENVTASAGHSDIITANASPRPWRVEPILRAITDIRGDVVANNLGLSDAVLIVDAVNNYGRQQAALHIAETHIRTVQMERDRLHDIVRRMVRLVNWNEQNEAGRALFREARAAIGEDKRP